MFVIKLSRKLSSPNVLIASWSSGGRPLGHLAPIGRIGGNLLFMDARLKHSGAVLLRGIRA